MKSFAIDNTKLDLEKSVGGNNKKFISLEILIDSTIYVLKAIYDGISNQ